MSQPCTYNIDCCSSLICYENTACIRNSYVLQQMELMNDCAYFFMIVSGFCVIFAFGAVYFRNSTNVWIPNLSIYLDDQMRAYLMYCASFVFLCPHSFDVIIWFSFFSFEIIRIFYFTNAKFSTYWKLPFNVIRKWPHTVSNYIFVPT